MATFDEKIKQQWEDGEEIRAIFRNFKKDGDGRKTKDYATKRLSAAEALWASFSARHHELDSMVDKNSDHDYYNKNYHESVRAAYSSLKTNLEQLLTGTERPESNNEGARPGTSRQVNATDGAASQGPAGGNGESPNLKNWLGLSTSRSAPTDEEERRTIRAQRATMAALTRLLKGVEDQLHLELSSMYFKQKLISIEKYWADIMEMHKRIMSAENQHDYEELYYSTLEDYVFDIAIQLKERIQGDSESGLSPPPSAGALQVNLPKITIPCFDGSYLKWTNFHDLYTDLIHKQKISPALKLQYLKSNLTGEPLQLIKHLQSSNTEHYLVAWNLLVDRYSNTRVLVTALLNDMLSQPQLQTESINGLKKMHDTTKECMHAISNLGVSTRDWDPLVLHILVQKLDKESRKSYEQSLDSSRDVQKLDHFFHFLEGRFQRLEAVGAKDDKRRTSTMFSEKAWTATCSFCKSGTHKIFNCSKFTSLSEGERNQSVRRLQLCFNCLRTGHQTKTCSSRGCTKCSQKHNTLLHPTAKQGPAQKGQPIAPNPTAGSTSSMASLKANRPARGNTQMVLPTAIVMVKNSTGTAVPFRALLDTGSQLHFVTQSMAHELGVKRLRLETPITGIGETRIDAQFTCAIVISSRSGTFSRRLDAVILPSLSAQQPSRAVDTSKFTIPTNIQLADPSFQSPQPIDMIIGAEFFLELLTDGRISGSTEQPIIQNTHLGWIIMGRATAEHPAAMMCHVATSPSLASLEKQVVRFWETEYHEEQVKRMTKEEFVCNQHFEETVKRTASGRFCVQLPFRVSPSTLGDSKEMALRRFLALEKRLSKDREVRGKYNDFMNEYEALGHMEPVQETRLTEPHFYMPHHCVMKPESSSTKLRVVFDASAKTTTGQSLNDVLMAGPTVQADLFSIITRFRIHQVVLTADIKKMYRQILVDTKDQAFQLILWRNQADDNGQLPILTYKLKTVTYGTCSAPFQATRCLVKLASDEQHVFPKAAQVLLRDMYVDDCLTGADSLAEAEDILQQLLGILKTGKFELSKFCSNSPDLLREIPDDHKEKTLTIHQSEVIKTLGLIWEPRADNFQFNYATRDVARQTKRTVLSDLAKLFDPLGLLGPVVLLGKLFLQELWKLNSSWDESLPRNLDLKWNSFMQQLEELNSITIPRLVVTAAPTSVQIHAFSDSSNLAYGACCYMRSINEFGQITSQLICSKSRVASLKSTTIARLELCGALLMAELVERLLHCLTLKIDEILYYTDSTTVLAWINSPSYTWSTYVANRVAKIQALSRPEQWKHIAGINNPADLISRGCFVVHLSRSRLWFNGPDFLARPQDEWAQTTFTYPRETPERRSEKSVLVSVEGNTSYIGSVNHKNSLLTLQRIFSYCFRFIHNCRKMHMLRTSGELSIAELDIGLTGVLIQVQRSSFASEYQLLAQNKGLSRGNFIASLSPYFDSTCKLIRVGGRLRNATLSPDAKNQILLPRDHLVTTLILNNLHFRHMHAAAQTLVAIARQRYWIIDATKAARQIVHKCVRCAKVKPRMLEQMMGNLPSDRVQPARPFYSTGVDFCGPISIHHKVRGKTATKAYIAVFICLCTKAIHLEVASDLSSEAFINALNRFIARRGLCATIYCDNATNFVGARSQLTELRRLFETQHMQDAIAKVCQTDKIMWKPIPPRSPHFGGIWESAVKLAKYHLVRHVGLTSLTYEELQTITAQIEAILNSRPITAMSSDPNDLEALTPGHFLIGEPMTSYAEPDITDQHIGHLKKFRQMQQIRQHFWKRWSAEYLQTLQPRKKWRIPQPNILPGTLVLLKDSNLPPLKWLMGRVTNTYQGADKLTRVADVKTQSGTFKRAIHNLCPLPVGSDTNGERAATKDEGDTNGKKNSQGSKPDDEHISQRLRSKGGRNPCSTLLMSLLVLLIVPQSYSVELPPISITSFAKSPGLYFEEIGKIQNVNNEWNIYVFFNLTSYYMELEHIQTYIDRIQGLCLTPTPNNTNTYCNETVTELKHKQTNINHYNELLHKMNGYQGDRRRARRSPFDIIGSVANGLFGVLDQGYAKEIEASLRALSDNDDHLLQLIKNQTSIVDSTLNVLRKTTEGVNKQFAVLTKRIAEVEASTNWASHSVYFNSITNYVMLIMSNYETFQKDLLEVLLDIHHAKMSPYILTPTQLDRELSLIRRNVPKSLTIPGEELLQIYKQMSVKARVTENAVLFKVKVPLPDIEQFQLFNIVSVPIVHGAAQYIINADAKYLAITILRDRFYLMTSEEFAGCQQFEPAQFLNPRGHSTFSIDSEVKHCEVLLMNHKTITGTASDCEVTPYKRTSSWIQLQNANSWIFAVARPERAALICGTSIINQRIEGSGVLTIQPPCMLKTSVSTLTSTTTFTSQLRNAFIPSVNLEEIIENINFGGQGTPTEPVLNISELTKLQAELETIKTQQVLPSRHDIHHYSGLYGFVALLAIIGGAWVCVKRRHNQKEAGPNRPNFNFNVEDASL